jgi:endonuclease G, mitochondrial
MRILQKMLMPLSIYRRMKKILLIACTFLFYACASNNTEELTPNEWEQGGKVIVGRTEIPRLLATDQDQFIDHTTTLNGTVLETYCMEYNYTKFHSRWVAFYMTASNSYSGSGVVRSDYGGGPGFVIDPDLPKAYQTDKSDYNPDYDRGHICASADRFYSQEANNQTFYYSNMSPQFNAFNAGIWMYLESKVRAWGHDRSLCDTLFITKGGTINDENNIMTYTTTGTHHVAVPRYYFMALLAKKGNSYHSIGFILEHKTDYPSRSFGFRQYAVTIKQLEQRTHIDFFPNLPDDIEQKVENTLEPLFWTDLNAD